MKKVFLILLVVFLLFGCSATQQTEDDTIWFVLMNKQHPVHHLMRLGFEDACRDYKMNCKYNTWEMAEHSRFIQGMEEVAAQGGYGVVTLVGIESAWTVVDEVSKTGMKVISVHMPFPEGEPHPNIASWISTDTMDYARRSAEAMGEKLGGKGTVAVTVSEISDLEKPIADEFIKYLNDNYPDIKTLPVEEEGFDVPQAIAVASAILQANPDVVGAFSTTGAGATTWARAAQDAGHNPGDVTIISMDYTMPNLDLMEEGWVYMLVGQPLYEEEYMAVELFYKMLNGESVEFANWLPAPMITIDNMSQWVDFNLRAEEKFGE